MTDTATVTVEPKAPAPPAEITPKPEMPRGVVPRDATKALFAALDAEAEGKTTTPESETSVAPEEGGETAEPQEKEAVPAEPTVDAEQEAKLPTKYREALKVIPDPKLRKTIADEHFRLREWERLQRDLGGVALEDLRQYVTAAAEVAPTPEVLQEMKTTADTAQMLASSFATGTPEGFGRMAGALLQTNPEAFVDFFGFLTGNNEAVAQGLSRFVHPALAQRLKGYRDNFGNELNRNVIANMREDSKQDGKEVLAEAADILEEYLDLKAGAEPKRPAPRERDERDVELERLRQQQRQAIYERVENFNNRVFQGAGGVLAQEIQGYVDRSLPGLSEKARGRHAVQLATGVYRELLRNQFVVSRAQRINAAGRLDDNHGNELANFYITQGRKLIPTIGGRLLSELREATEPAARQRDQRIKNQMSRRDVGASGKPPAPSKPDLKSVSAKGDLRQIAKGMFDILDKQAEEG